MGKKIKLADVPVGKSIGAFGKKFTVLDHTDNGVLVLSEIIETEMPFREKCEVFVAPNDFCDSDIYHYLNGEYLAELTNGADNTDDIVDMEIDLKCTLGQHEYETWKAKVGILTLEQFGKYFDIIPKVDDCWWLATPYGTPLRSPNPNNVKGVWYVDKDGLNFIGLSYDSRGARPALILESSLLVSCDGVTDDNVTKFSDYSDEELLAEIKRRFKMTDFIS